MATLLKRVTDILGTSLKDFQHHLESVSGTRRITGFIISTSFVGKEDEKRQTKVWKILEAELSSQDLQLVGPIVAMTPEEAALHEPSQ